MRYGVRYVGARNRGFARFAAIVDVRSFMSAIGPGYEVIDLITGEVVEP